VRTEALLALKAPAFSYANAMRHVSVLTRYGPRVAGSAADRTAANYVAAQLRSYGYAVRFQTVYLPGGRTTRNVIAERRGSTTRVIVLGAHIDSKWPSPGGNDNGSGVAAMLEVARVCAQAPVAPTIRFIAFGGEESAGSRPDDHHFGSRQYVRIISSTQRARIESMVSLDMIGYGSRFSVRSWRGRLTTVGSLRNWGSYTAEPLVFERDTSRYGLSDHEAFERAGIPSAWLEWRPDTAWHTRSDTAAHVSANRVRRTGRLARSWLLKLTPAQLDALR
jgi:Zn-dependent M28 family amino/carboxypeptidase